MNTVLLIWKANPPGIKDQVSTISLKMSVRFPVSIFKLKFSNLGGKSPPINSTALDPGGPSSRSTKLLPDISLAASMYQFEHTKIHVAPGSQHRS